jgi:hypothetical protein
MAEDTVVAKEVLTDGMIKAGERLTRILDSRGWPVTASMWFYFPDENRWKLLIASPVTSEQGAKKAYMDIQKALDALPPDVRELELEDIVAIEENHPLVSLLGKVVQTDGDLAGIRFSRNAVEGQFIEDAYIYKLKRKNSN